MAHNLLSLQSHAGYSEIEERFNRSLDTSLDPRGPELLYDLVAEFGLPVGALAIDVGCGTGRHTIELARRFGLRVRGVDPVRTQVALANGRLTEAAGSDRDLAKAVSFEPGSAEHVPADDGSVDLIWCRDVLSLEMDLGRVYQEFRRVLKPGGRALVYQMFATERLEPREAGWLLPTMGCSERNMNAGHAEAAMRSAGLDIDRCLVLGPEWGEYRQERAGFGGQKLLHAARLRRDPSRYVQEYGKENYDIALGDCLWHIYRLIGKLSDRVYLLSPSR